MTEPHAPRIRILLNNPVTGLLLGILCTLLSIRLTTNRILPVYLADSQVEPSSKRNGQIPSNLTSDEKRCMARVAFWNSGSEIISKDQFTDADPLRIVSSKPIQLISLDAINKSRASLRFVVHHYERGLYLRVKDGDALDPLDGALFKITYLGDCDTGFGIQGRVIGARRIAYRGESTLTFKYWYALPMMIPINIALWCLLAFYLFRYRNHNDASLFLWFITLSIVIAFFLWNWESFPYREPSWLPRFYAHQPSADIQHLLGEAMVSKDTDWPRVF